MPLAEWAAAWAKCVSSRSHALVEQQDALLVYVDTRHTFHPMHALLALDASSSSSSAAIARSEPSVPFVLILALRLHPELVKLNCVLKPSHADLADAILADVVFEKRIEDQTTQPSGATGSPVLRMLPSLFARQVNLTSGALRTYAQDAAEANGVLSELTMAIQSQCDLIQEASEDLNRFMLLVEHETGYVGQVMNTQELLITSVVDARVTEITSREHDSMNLDSLLEDYELGHCVYLDMIGDQSQPETIQVCVRAGFKLWSRGSPHDLSERVRAYLLSTWSGIENVHELLGKPASQAMSELCFEIVQQSEPSFASTSSIADAEALETFPEYLRQSIQLLQNLENVRDLECELLFDCFTNADINDFKAAKDPQTPWKTLHLHAPADSSVPLNLFRKLIDDQHADLRASDDNTMDMSITLTFDGDDHQAKPRYDVDFLEQMWDFCVRYVRSADASISIVREFLVTFLRKRESPFVNPTNPTKLATFLRERVDIFRDSSVEDPSLSLVHVQQDLSQPKQALAALIELGQWIQRQSVASWFSRVGFTIIEANLLADELRFLHATTQFINPWQKIVDVCACGYSMGLSISQLRILVSNCMPQIKRQKDGMTSAPGIVLPLNFYLPDHLRSKIAGYVHVDLQMGLSDLTSFCICRATSMGYVHIAER